MEINESSRGGNSTEISKIIYKNTYSIEGIVLSTGDRNKILAYEEILHK